MGDLSPHFALEEFRCKGTGLLPPPNTLAHLVEHLERLRSSVGRPMHIVSGYRAPSHNAAVGGAPDSRHMRGDAVDVRAGYCTVVQAEAAGFTGIGTKAGKVRHIDLRPRAARWTY